ncbi:MULTISPECIES: hypothetical protein [Acidithiobacillus]|uniref:hypothetical protein n=1 Tax=Acidithiobacillus TaxID=119977 RepID=UPI00094AD086|nr:MULTISPECIES: hypothetical protein [Acidithiobacillus]MBE7563637.1 hypothetical protein [Acidithiobacillus sp. HP-6]MBE7570950.1 hypothetical protein [Acidithiobacillus sp. HP-2]
MQIGRPTRRVCADFFDDPAIELDLLEVQLGINRAYRNKGERDTALMELAVLSLKKHVAAYSGLNGDKYPSYADVAAWLESDGYLSKFTDFLLHDKKPALIAHDPSQPAEPVDTEHGHPD